MPRNMKPSRPNLRKSQFSSVAQLYPTLFGHAKSRTYLTLIQEEIKSLNSSTNIKEITSII